MYMETTIRLSNSVKERLDFFKVHPRESYNDVIARITENSKVKVDEESLKETIEILGDPEIMRDIAEALENIDCLGVDYVSAQTNMVFVSLPLEAVATLRPYLAENKVLIAAGQRIRLVTHLDIGREDIERTIGLIQSFFS